MQFEYAASGEGLLKEALSSEDITAPLDRKERRPHWNLPLIDPIFNQAVEQLNENGFKMVLQECSDH